MSQEYFAPSSFNDVHRSGTRRLQLSPPTSRPHDVPSVSPGGRGRGQRTHPPNLVLGHNGYLLPARATSSPSSPPWPSAVDEGGTITEFYGPAEPSSLPPRGARVPYRGPPSRNTSLTPQKPQPSVWKIGAPSHTPSRVPQHSGYSTNFPPPRTTGSGQLVTDLSFPDSTKATPLSELNGKQTFIDCPSCQKRALTRLEEESGQATKWRCKQMLVFCCFGALLPLIYKWEQDLEHYCMNCGKKIAVQKYSIEENGLQKAEVLWPMGDNRESQRQYESTERRMSMGKEERNAAAAGPRELAAGADAERKAEIDGKPVILEIEGKPRANAEMPGDDLAKEREVQAVFEMEHMNRGPGTQKRIRTTLGAGREEQALPLPAIAPGKTK